MRTQPRHPAAPNRDLREDLIEHHVESPSIENPFMEDDPFIPMPLIPTLSAPRRSTATATPTSVVLDNTVHTDAVQKDAMQNSPLIASGQAPELDGLEELGPQLVWVSLNAPRGLLVCKNPDLEVCEFFGTIVESRVVRVMKDRDDKGGVFCASSNRRTADVGRPGRECVSCEDRAGGCFPRWWIAWREEESGQVFAHTLSQTGTINFTRYAAKLKRDGHLPSEVVTRIFVEEARQQKAGTAYRRLQFEQDDPFRDQ